MALEFTERRIQSNGNTTNFNIDRKQPYIDKIENGKRTRIYGTQEQLKKYESKKPDGSPANTSGAPVSIPKGIAERIEAAFYKKEAAVDNLKDGKSSIDRTNNNTVGGSGKNLKNLVSNPLENFASYSPLWTLAVLTPQQYNNPTSYRTEDLSFAGQTEYLGDVSDFASKEDYTKISSSIIFSSAGRGDKYRTRTYYGTPEYYVDNFEMTALVSASQKTGNTNAIKFNFEIYEPFSMGLLLQSLQVAAVKAGYLNYLDAPYVLRLDFKGFDEDTTLVKSVKPKFFVMKLKRVKFAVDESGSKYEVEAFPFNHQGYSDLVNTAFDNIKIKGDTVEEALKRGENSLTSVLNKNEQSLVEKGKYLIKDVYDIQFPENSNDFVSNTARIQKSLGATINVDNPAKVNSIKNKSRKVDVVETDFQSNPIGKSSFGFEANDGGNFSFARSRDVMDDDGKIIRDKMKIDVKNREFLFNQGQPLTDIIIQTILSSKYAADAISKEENLTPEGYIKWFRIDVQIELLDYDTLVGDFAKKYTFRVVPFFVHSSIFTNPNAVPPGYDSLEKKIVKKYEYIYTGQNNDIINFDVKINNMFYAGSNPSIAAETKDMVNNDQGGTTTNKVTKDTTQKGNESKAQTANLGKSKTKRDPNLFSLRKGGAGVKNVEKKIAESFHEAFISGSTADLISVDLEVIGDTYWLVDSGISNYFAKPSSTSEQITQDGTANYEGSDIYIYITFRTPADIEETPDGFTGLYRFGRGGQESPFSGIYKVTKCTSLFSSGTFTQTLRCLRMQGQKFDYDGENYSATKQGALLYDFDGLVENKSDPAQQIKKNNSGIIT